MGELENKDGTLRPGVNFRAVLAVLSVIIIHPAKGVASSTLFPAAIPGSALQRVYFLDESDVRTPLPSQGSPDTFAQA